MRIQTAHSATGRALPVLQVRQGQLKEGQAVDDFYAKRCACACKLQQIPGAGAAQQVEATMDFAQQGGA